MNVKCLLLLSLLGLAAAAPLRGSRTLLARASSKTEAVASGGGSAESVGSAIARGDVTAIANAFSEANNGGEAKAAADAAADGYKNGSQEQKDAIANALASATDLSYDDANKALQNGDTQNIATAIAASTGGQTDATAVSVSEAVSEQNDAFVDAIVTSYSSVNGGGEAFAAANVAATAIGVAIAKAYARSEVTLSISGEGDAFGEARASAQAVATASATVIGQGIAEAANEFNKVAVTFKKEVVSEAIAKASADAYVKGTQEGKGFASVVQESVSEAVAKPVATLIFEVLAVTFGKDYDTLVYVEAADSTVEESAKTDSSSTVDTSVGGSGVAQGGADAETWPLCTFTIKAFCCGRGRDSKSDGCMCSRFSGDSCKAKREEANSQGYTTLWKETNGDICSCEV